MKVPPNTEAPTAGFSIHSYEETPGWNDRLGATFQAVLDQHALLTQELGEDGYASFSLEVSITLGVDPYRRTACSPSPRDPDLSPSDAEPAASSPFRVGWCDKVADGVPWRALYQGHTMPHSSCPGQPMLGAHVGANWSGWSRLLWTWPDTTSLLTGTDAHERTGVDSALASYGSEGWGFESLRAR